ncbi:tubulin PhuZ [Pseudomonas phage PhiPA3]|uniref:Phage tubulin-like protein n=1 Tax=Pseudomonas phage PhiPA3 TaxID=998086 RepID=PHUZ_BPPA3|nr:tubulin PhuZ [Pseudomonas phage PhiPA3]F8SJR0.1 RecName: Full=Phage tubulin-like protein; Short=PhuZ; AltName: Full=Phage tubulin/FtsZ; AltName: Full=Tubulin-like protein TubZ [Pseudomonas phage PhiPA3]AEH03455.1 hypothetical protein [Pseudomonas phage PhiPA3]
MSKVKTRVYCCGGTGMDIGVNLQWHPDLVFIDTCDKNVTADHDLERVFLTEGTRGAGKNRRYMLPIIRPQVPGFLERYPAGDFNIVVFGLGGGSGSTIGPVIVSELAKAGESVAVVCMSGIEATEVLQNDIDTLKTLEGIAAATNTPVVINHIENVNGVPYTELDKEAIFNIHALINLTSQKHVRLDKLDIDNWINFTKKHNQIQPQLCQLHISNNRQEATSVPEPIAIASLFADASREVAFGTPFVRTVGISDVSDPDLLADQLHFVINSIGVASLFGSLTKQKQELEAAQVRYQQRNAIIDIDDNRTDDGFVV